MSIRDDVAAFHLASNMPIAEKPTIPPEDRVRLRGALVAEECFEFLESLFEPEAFELLKAIVAHRIATAPVKVDMVGVADSLGDIDYVVEGTRLEFGIDGDPVAAEIQRSNMAKFPDGRVVKREDGKILKPDTWTPPDIVGVLRKLGWEG